jgi:hypothetical protein
MHQARATLPKISSSSDAINSFTREFPAMVQRSLLNVPDTPGLTTRAIVEAFVSTVEGVQREP